MTIKEEIYVVSRVCPLLHVSAGNCNFIATPVHYIDLYTSNVQLVHLFHMLVLKGPPKVEGVMFGNNIVENGRIHQEVKWSAPVLRHNKFPKYTIRYADIHEQSSVPNITLQLPFKATNITYYVVVAVRSSGKQKRGDYSDPVSITYTSEFTHADMHDRTNHVPILYRLYRMHC